MWRTDGWTEPKTIVPFGFAGRGLKIKQPTTATDLQRSDCTIWEYDSDPPAGLVYQWQWVKLQNLLLKERCDYLVKLKLVYYGLNIYSFRHWWWVVMCNFLTKFKNKNKIYWFTPNFVFSFNVSKIAGLYTVNKAVYKLVQRF